MLLSTYSYLIFLDWIIYCSFESYVASTGIEPVSGASETLILSIVLRGRLPDQTCCIAGKDFYGNSQQNYTKKLTDRHQPGFAQQAFDYIERSDHQVNKDQID